MNNKYKIISGIIIMVLLISNIITLVLLLNKKDNCNVNEIDTNKSENSIVGIYHNSNWNNRDATLQLNEDMTCKYPNSNDTCKWTFDNGKLTITLSTYHIKYDNKDLQLSSSSWNIEACEESLENLKEEYKLINGRCEASNSEHEANIVNGGILLHDHVFNKIN